MFELMAEVMIEYWMEVLGEIDFLTLFKAIYLDTPWNGWFISASRIPEVIQNQNPQEINHRLMKNTQCAGKLHSSTEYCTNHTIWEIIANSRISSSYGTVSNFGPLPTALRVKAYENKTSPCLQLQLLNMQFDDVTYQGYIVKSNLAENVSLTRLQAKIYINLLEGNYLRINSTGYSDFCL